jgi:hypothetical protein
MNNDELWDFGGLAEAEGNRKTSNLAEIDHSEVFFG